MANDRNLRKCHSTVYILLCICFSVKFTNCEDVPYDLLNSPSTFNSVIFLDGHGIYKRSVNGSSSSTGSPSAVPASTGASSIPDTTAATTAPPTVKSGTTKSTVATTTPAYNEVKDKNSHKYYKSKVLTVKSHTQPYWEELGATDKHDALSASHRVAVSITMGFSFPFYGHMISKVTIATGGFLYMSPFLHQWLTATQYIAPLMANFDTTLGNMSDILYKDFGNRFVIEWRNIYLKDQNHTNPFYFQTILHSNGTIVFSYKVVPLTVLDIEATSHPVKVGLSDAFYIDSVVGGVQRRTIYEYHRVEINTTLISEHTVVILEPLITCNLAKDCDTCVTQQDEFNCKWCGKVQRCSDGIDWKRQDWRDKGCEILAFDDQSRCMEFTTASVNTTIQNLTSSTTIGQLNTSSTTKKYTTLKPTTSKRSTPLLTSVKPTISTTTTVPVTPKSTIPKTTTKMITTTKPATPNPTSKPTTKIPTTTKSTTKTLTSKNPTPPTTTKATTTRTSAKPTTPPTTTKPTIPTTTTKPTTPLTTTKTSTKPPASKHTTIFTTSPKSTKSSTSKLSSTMLPYGCVAGSGNCSMLNKQTQKKKSSDNTIVAVVIVIILLLTLMCCIGGWFYYAYTHPTSASGVWLIEHRPSQMKAKMANMKFWKRSTPSGEKYAVETEA